MWRAHPVGPFVVSDPACRELRRWLSGVMRVQRTSCAACAGARWILRVLSRTIGWLMYRGRRFGGFVCIDHEAASLGGRVHGRGFLRAIFALSMCV
jgi:hypothetical protein